MLQRVSIVVLLFAVVACGADYDEETGSLQQNITVPSGFVDETIATGLSNPTAMAFAPDGRLFVCQQGGALRVIKNGTLLTTPFLQLTVNSSGERGLLGVAFDPAFATTRHIYLYYTATSPTIHNRLSRFTASTTNPDQVQAGSEVVLMDLPTLSATNHNGGAIHFGNDGLLYIAVGENAVGSNAQSLNTPLGKILRINRDGTIPTSNPFFNSTTGLSRAIWALGLRNPFTFDVRRTTGAILINDVGQDTWEEINAGQAGANYGWPTTEGPTTNPSFTSPIFSYMHGGSVCAISGGAFYDPVTVQFPSDFVGDYFFADFCAGWIRKLDPATRQVTDFATGAVSPVDLKVGPEGALYYLFRGSSAGAGGVGRVRSSSAEPPRITQHPQSLTRAVGQSATFSVGATGSQPLAFQWRRNGQNISGATSSSFTISSVATADNGAQFSALVSNAFGTAVSNSATLTVTTSSAPVAGITAPTAGDTYAAGDTINFSGTGTDAEDGALPASAFSWNIVFHHADHTHPFQDVNGVRSGAFTVPRTGETATNVFFRIRLTVRDSTGLTDTEFVDVSPRTSLVTLQTDPPGLRVTLDGIPVTAPSTVPSVEGMTRRLGAVPSQSLNGRRFVFASWSDGGAATHDIVTPTVDTTFTARFVESPCPAGTSHFNGHCYSVVTTTQTYNNALSTCQARGSGWSLAEVTSSGENSFIQGLLAGVDHWLGGIDRAVEGAWVWQSGAPFWSGGSTGGPVGGSFTNFVSGEPNNTGGTGAADCLRMITTGQWRDSGCDSVFRAVCESDTRPTCSDGVQNGTETGVDCGGSCPACGGACVAGQQAFGEHCYQVITTALAFDSAQSSCQALGAGWSLAEITSSAENSFAQGLLAGMDHWLGATDRAVEGTWAWRSGAQFWSGGSNGGPLSGSFTNFVSGEPNNTGGTGAADCLRMITTGQWRDSGCDSVFRALCESGTL